LFSGNHPLLEKGYAPCTVRFFMLQSHYSSTLDSSNEALQAAEKDYRKLSHALKIIKELEHSGEAEKLLDSVLLCSTVLLVNCRITLSNIYAIEITTESTYRKALLLLPVSTQMTGLSRPVILA
jgi:cysteinyl-tRNA synthetase